MARAAAHEVASISSRLSTPAVIGETYPAILQLLTFIKGKFGVIKEIISKCKYKVT